MKNWQMVVVASLAAGLTPAQAELIRDGVWQVEQGQSLDQVLGAAFPNQALRQRRIERLAKRLSPRAFDENGQLIPGQELRLPGAQMPSEQPVDQAAGSQVGRVVVTTGSSSATGADGSQRKLERGAAVYEGDTLSTERARAQVRFSDGSLVSLRPNTQFKVEEYRYDGQEGEEERGLFNLIKGGFRTISGAIGKLNQDNYQVKTAVATIGIRGTHYGLTICDPCTDGDDDRSGLFGGVVDGEIVVKNDQGEFTFGNDEYFHLPNEGGKPKGLIVPPGFVFGGDDDDMEGEGESGDSPESGDGEGQEGGNNFADPGNRDELDQSQQAFFEEENNSFDAARNDQELRVYLEDQVEEGEDVFPATGDPLPEGDVLQIGFIGDGSTIASLGEGVSSALVGSQAYIREREGGGFDLTDINFTDEQDGTNYVFHSEGATLQNAGFNSAYGISWGRWDDAVITATNDEGDGLEGVAVDVPVKTGLHFMVTENAVSDYSELAAEIDESGFNSGYGNSISLGPKFSGTGFFGSNPTDMAGNEGTFNSGYMQIDDSGSGYEITYFSVDAEIANNQYNLTSSGTVLVENLVNNPNHSLALAGNCSSGSPGAACYGGNVALEGAANFQFLINRGGSNVGAATLVNGYAPTDPTIGFAGGILLTDDGGV